MSSSTLLYSIQQSVLRIGGPILITIGSISCILNLMVFTQSTLRKNPCTICLIAVNIINFLYFYLGLLLTTLADGYNIDPSTSNIGFCRFRYYIAQVLACWQSSCLILASIDRVLITSRNATTRQRSTRSLIAVSMIGIGLFWTLFHIHALIFMEILQYGPDYSICYYQPGVYTTFMTYYAFTVNGFLPPSLMAIFGCWTVKNIRGVPRARFPPSNSVNTGNVPIGRPHAIQSKDQQLIRMLLVDIISFVICKLPSTIVLIYRQITQYNDKSDDQQVIELSILQLSFFWYFVDNGIGCYTNILVSKTFRTELKRMFANGYKFCVRQLH
jgi:hypothetical protein